MPKSNTPQQATGYLTLLAYSQINMLACLKLTSKLVNWLMARGN